jgi:hypothetical protein
MAENIKLPLVGEVKKRTAYLGGGAILLIVGIAYYRSKKAKQATALASGDTTGTVTDPAGNVCAALDPQSGYCPGSPEDEQYLQQQSAGLGGYGIGYPGAGYGSFVTDAQGNTCTAIDPATGLCPVGGATGRTSVTTNAQWVNEAELQLGYTTTVQQALGYVLSGQPVTADQKRLFMEAVGLLGPPPQGYPPINVVGGNHHPGPKNRVKVPNLAGQRVAVASEVLRDIGLKPGIPNRKPGVAYDVTSTSPAAGKEVTEGSTVHLSIKPVTGPPVREIPGGPMVRV